MRLIGLVAALILLSVYTPSFAHAKVRPIEESALPFELSPYEFDNSPSNFDNSLSNFDNSSANFENTSSNLENSPSNFENSPSGDRRLLIEDDGKTTYAGYYVFNKDGVVNFFSPSGARMFYNPSESQAVFDAEEGEFCGAFVTVKGELTLVLTRRGQKLLLLSE
jgi:hypothetical protein